MNLPIPSTPPANAATNNAASSNDAPAQANAPQASDPFGHVLARQLADAPATKAKVIATKTGEIVSALNDKKILKTGAVVPDAATLPQAGILAVMMQIPLTQAASPANTAEQTVAASAIKLSTPQPLTLTNQSVPVAPRDSPQKSTNNFAAILQGNNPANTTARQMTGQTPSGLEGVLHASTLPELTEKNGAFENTLPQIAQTQLTQASLPLLAAEAGKMTLATPLSSNRWNDDFSQKITWLATQRDQSAELHLNPPNLGPLDVVIKVSGDQATAFFTSPHAMVRDAVEQALPRLREMLADNGIMLGNATVSDQGQRDNPEAHTQGRTAAPDDNPVIIGSSMGARALPVANHNGMVDTFA
jgi:flagellar hook-length control protein FliK